MKNKEIISQLESLKENSRSFLDATEPCSIWQDDIEALDAAIAMVKEHPLLEKKVKLLENRLKHHGNKKPVFRRKRAFHI
ncbi:MAG: hypothetical protein IKO94_07470 [Selenomonadaceae bacterium]|nr:hypothetical protein [Selenomonadaceae bacterium]